MRKKVEGIQMGAGPLGTRVPRAMRPQRKKK
jgi:hypothetical protein